MERRRGVRGGGATWFGAAAVVAVAMASRPAAAQPGDPAAPPASPSAPATPADPAPKPEVDGAASVGLCPLAEGVAAEQARRLRAALAAFERCAAPSCDDDARRECERRATAVRSALPTVIVTARDVRGSETTFVTVTVGGEVVRSRLDGKPIALDPGPHRVRFTLAGNAPLERTLVLAEGEKNRRLEVSFATPPRARPVGPPVEAGGQDGVEPLVFVLGGVGVAGLGLFATFGALGLDAYGELERSCAPRCSDAEVDVVRDRFLVADVALGASVVALSAAVVLALRSPSGPRTARDPRPVTELRLGDGPAGAAGAGFTRTF